MGGLAHIKVGEEINFEGLTSQSYSDYVYEVKEASSDASSPPWPSLANGNGVREQAPLQDNDREMPALQLEARSSEMHELMPPQPPQYQHPSPHRTSSYDTSETESEDEFEFSVSQLPLQQQAMMAPPGSPLV